MTSALPDIAPQPLRDRWLDIAAANASTKWVKQFIHACLPQLQQGQLLPDRFAALFEAELGQRKLIEPAQRKNYRSNLVQALKMLDPNWRHGNGNRPEVAGNSVKNGNVLKQIVQLRHELYASIYSF